MERNFKYFVEKYGEAGAREYFEVACHTMLEKKYGEALRIKGNPGDEGIDIYVGNLIHKINVFQCKFFMNELDYKQINRSFLRAVNNENYSMNSWTLLIPQDLIFKEQSRWDTWKAKMEEAHHIKIFLMHKSAIINQMKEFKVYDQIFDNTRDLQIQKILDKVNKITNNNNKANKDFIFLIKTISEYISHRLDTFKNLYTNSYDIEHYFKKQNVSSFLELYQKAEIRNRFLFKEIDNLIIDLDGYDKELGYLCKQFVFMEKSYVKEIEEALNYQDEILLKLKSYIFQIHLRKIIWELSVEEQNLKRYFNKKSEKAPWIHEFDDRDTLIVYNSKKELLELLALYVLKINDTLDHQRFTIFYGQEDETQLCFPLVTESIFVSGYNTPISTSDMIRYIQYSNTKINDKGKFTFILSSNNIIFFEELDSKALLNLKKLKSNANIKYHHFIQETKLSRSIQNLEVNEIDYKILTLKKERRYSRRLRKLLKNIIPLDSGKFNINTHFDGSIVITTENSFEIRKPSTKN